MRELRAENTHEMTNFDGVDFTNNPSHLPPNILSNAQNTWAGNTTGVASKRPGSAAYASYASGSGTFSQSRGLKAFYRSNGTRTVVWAVQMTTNGIAFFSVSDAGVVTSIGGGTTLSAGDVSFDVYNDNLYASNGTGPIKKWTGTGFMTDVAGGWTSGRRGRYLNIYTDRLIASGGTDLPGRMYYSNQASSGAGDIETIGSGGQYEMIGDRSGDVITGQAIYGVRTDTEGLAAGIVFFKNGSLWSLVGSLVAGGSIDQISGKVGTVAAKTIAYTPFGLIFLGQDNVYLLRSEGEPIPVGGRILPRLRAIPNALRSRACATYHNGHYKLWFAQSGASVNNDCYWLDLREFPEKLKWWGPMRNTSGSTVLYGFDFVEVLRSDDRPFSTLSSDSDSQAIAVETGRARVVRLDANVFDDQGTAISMIATSHHYGAGSLWLDKIWSKWGATVKTDPGQSFTADVTMDDGEGSYSTSIAVSSAGAQWDVGQWDVAIWGDTFMKHVADSILPVKRAKKAELRITHSTAFDFQIAAMQLGAVASEEFMKET